MDVLSSVNGVPIRLTSERWEHILSNKPYMEPLYEKVLDAIEEPTWILRGYAGALVAVLSLGPRGYLNVIYREVSQHDGFIITAFLSKKVNRRMVIWPMKY